MDRFNKLYITCTLINLMNRLNVLFGTVQLQSMLTDQSAHKPIELNETCMDAILKALSTVMNETRRKKC